MLYEFKLKTEASDQIIDITNSLLQAVQDSGVTNGLATIYCPHTTAAITINENGDYNVRRDLLYALDHFFPDLKEYKHFEGNSKAHLKSSIIGVSETIIIRDGRPLLGTWQSPYFCEFDGPRNRRFYINIA